MKGQKKKILHSGVRIAVPESATARQNVQVVNAFLLAPPKINKQGKRKGKKKLPKLTRRVGECGRGGEGWAVPIPPHHSVRQGYNFTSKPPLAHLRVAIPTRKHTSTPIRTRRQACVRDRSQAHATRYYSGNADRSLLKPVT